MCGIPSFAPLGLADFLVGNVFIAPGKLSLVMGEASPALDKVRAGFREVNGLGARKVLGSKGPTLGMEGTLGTENALGRIMRGTRTQPASKRIRVTTMNFFMGDSSSSRGTAAETGSFAQHVFL
jgi:hypothetical protein